ncbi:putative leader peptide [Streptomyces eurythermus]|uniref:putative leader peptide n=1 Tax=Streptomyces eurythermus TaxID=42237 RepID=UPI00369A9B9A
MARRARGAREGRAPDPVRARRGRRCPSPGRAGRCAGGVRLRPAPIPCSRSRPRGDTRLTKVGRHAVLPIVTDTYVRLWRRVHMDLVRYAGCVCRPSC